MLECKHSHLELGDKCDKCDVGTLRAGSATKWQYIPDWKTMKAEPKSFAIEMECDKCGHMHGQVQSRTRIDAGRELVVEGVYDMDKLYQSNKSSNAVG